MYEPYRLCASADKQSKSLFNLLKPSSEQQFHYNATKKPMKLNFWTDPSLHPTSGPRKHLAMPPCINNCKTCFVFVAL